MPYGLKANKHCLSPSMFCAPVMASNFVASDYKNMAHNNLWDVRINSYSLSWKAS